MNRNILLGLAFVPILLYAQEKYKVRSIAWERLEVTAALDATPEAEAFEIVKPYKHSVDSVMMPFLGVSRTAMSAGRPESLLGNWAADVMVETSTATGLERADLGVVNVGGLRNNMPEGNVRRGDVMLISPFQNNVVDRLDFDEGMVQGSDLQQLMCDIAAVHGEAVSSSVRLVITKDGKLVSATIGGQPIDPMRTYRLATIDYLLDGNDKLYSMKRHGKVYPMNMLSRDAMSEYIIKTKVIDSKLEGRIVVQ